jgi:TolB-like protein
MKKFLILLMILSIYLFSGSSAFSQGNILSQKVSQLADKLAFAVEGEVVGVSGDTVYINLGQASGIIEGIPFEVVRLDRDRPFKMGDRIIGYPETEVGQIEITAVRKEMSLAKITEKIMDIQEGDKVYQQMKKVTRVAITEFTYGDEFNSFTRNVQDILYTNLIQRGMTVVEREKMEQVMEELAESFSGMIDTSTAAEIGKMLGVEAIIVGTVADMGNSVDLRARLVDVEQGAAITAAQVDVEKIPTITSLLGSQTRGILYEGKSSAAKKDSKTALEANAEGFNFKLVDWHRKGKNLVLELLITSEEDNWLRIYASTGIFGKITRMFDNIGNESRSNEVQLGNYMGTSSVDNMLVAGEPIMASISFANISSQVKLITFLEIACLAKEKNFFVQFRDIPITD